MDPQNNSATINDQLANANEITPEMINSTPQVSWFWRMINTVIPSWRPTSDAQLREAEQKMLEVVSTPIQQQMVTAGGHQINTVKLGSGPPLVLVHGFGGGIGLWTCNYDELAKHHTVYAIDLIGFGRSSRPEFTGSTPEEAEDFFVNNLEHWRQAMKLEDFTLLGHSLGAYVSAGYALKYAHESKLKHLILADPFGVPRKPDEDPSKQRQIPLHWRIVSKIVNMGTPLSAVRVAGPMGPSLVSRLRTDFRERFLHLYPAPSTAVLDYIYHLSAQKPSGEVAFKYLSKPIGWAVRPLDDRLPALPKHVPVSFIYGSHSWMDRHAAYALKEKMPDHNVEISVVPNAGHHLYADNHKDFNEEVIKAGRRVLQQAAAVKQQYSSNVNNQQQQQAL